MLAKYTEVRDAIYRPIREEGVFTWDFMYEQEYALASCHLISRTFLQEMRQAAEALGKIFAKTVSVVQEGPDALLRELGIPRETWPAIRGVYSGPFVTVVGRFDFAKTPAGLKMLEFNSDTPTGVVEAFYVNERVCEHYGVQNPNQGMNRQISHAFQEMAAHYQQLAIQTENIYFSALHWHAEDAGTTRYLLRESKLPGEFVPLSSLAVNLTEERLYTFDPQSNRYRPIDLLYRLHALEFFAKDKGEYGYPIGAKILELVGKKKLALINPPSAFVAQTKAMQALIWNLHEHNLFYTQEEHEIIDTYFLPTYLENRFIGKKAYVVKPVLGREGGAVTLFDQQGNVIVKDQANQYWDQMMVYQEMAELESIEVMTLKGPFQGKVLWGCFLIGGKPSAVLARVDREITGNLSYYLPVGLKN
jgi:glutathionylspermidine synthase